jgi:hypothetical protein
MVNRRTIPLAVDARLRQVIMDTGAADFSNQIAEFARTCSAQGQPLYAASCIGIGSLGQSLQLIVPLQQVEWRPHTCPRV